VTARSTLRCETYYSRALYQAELRRASGYEVFLILRPFDLENILSIEATYYYPMMVMRLKIIALSCILLSLLLVFSGEVVAQGMDTINLVAPSIVIGWSFPQSEAGLGAYINTGQVVNLEKLKAICSKVEIVGDNYIVGIIPISDWGGNIDVHLYADRDGWLVAYLKKSDPISMVMQWGTSDPDNPTISVIGSNTLMDALKKAGDAAGAKIIADGVGYYDFEFPNADRMMIIANVQATAGSSVFQIEMPNALMLFEAAYYHYTWCYSWQSLGKNHWTGSALKVDGALISNAATGYVGHNRYQWWRGLGQFKDAISPDKLHTIEISHDGADEGSSGAAAVMIFRAA
jgi:hypothetical protein